MSLPDALAHVATAFVDVQKFVDNSFGPASVEATRVRDALADATRQLELSEQRRKTLIQMTEARNAYAAEVQRLHRVIKVHTDSMEFARNWLTDEAAKEGDQ